MRTETPMSVSHTVVLKSTRRNSGLVMSST